MNWFNRRVQIFTFFHLSGSLLLLLLHFRIGLFERKPFNHGKKIEATPSRKKLYGQREMELVRPHKHLNAKSDTML